MIDYRLFLHFYNTKHTHTHTNAHMHSERTPYPYREHQHCTWLSFASRLVLPSNVAIKSSLSQFLTAFLLVFPSRWSLWTKLHEFRFIFMLFFFLSLFRFSSFILSSFDVFVRSLTKTNSISRMLFTVCTRRNMHIFYIYIFCENRRTK